MGVVGVVGLLAGKSEVTVALIAATAVIITGILTWRASVRKSALEELRTLIDAERTSRKEEEERTRGRMDELQGEIRTLEAARVGDGRYIDVLIAHIYAGKPPPPPPRPVIVVEQIEGSVEA